MLETAEGGWRRVGVHGGGEGAKSTHLKVKYMVTGHWPRT